MRSRRWRSGNSLTLRKTDTLTGPGHLRDHRTKGVGRHRDGQYAELREQQWPEPGNQLEVQQPLDPHGDVGRYAVPSRAVAHQSVGVDRDPGVGEDPADRPGGAHLDALQHQLQVVLTEVPELAEVPFPQWQVAGPRCPEARMVRLDG
jgi:hypothetical protein